MVLCVFFFSTCPGALGGEGLDRGGGPAGESQERHSVHTRGCRGANDQTPPAEGGPHLPSREQMVHSHQGERFSHVPATFSMNLLHVYDVSYVRSEVHLLAL